MKLNSSKDIGGLVRQARKDQDLTQLQLAERVGVSRDWIIRLEQGKGSVELALVLRTLKALGLSLRVAQEQSMSVSGGDVVDLGKILNPKGGA